nr:PqqD family peptide modification chaperone [Ruminococcus sp.]
MLKAMLDEYEVSEEKASADIDTFIQKLREADVLE